MVATLPKPDLRYTWKVTASSFLGNTLEYYDFLVYGTAAAVVFPKVFFPDASGFVATLSAFGTFAVGMIIVLESAPPNRRGFFSAWPNTGGFSAQILITGVFAYIYTLPDDQLLSWGWRIPFLLSAVVLIVTFWMRRSLHETPVFTEAVAGDKEGEAGAVEAERPKHGPIRTIFVDDWRNLLLIIGLRFAEALPYFLLTVFALSYGSSALGLEKTQLNNAILIAAVLSFISHGVFSAISDRIGRRPVYFFGAVVVFVMAFPFFAMLHSGSMVLIVLGYVLVLNLGHNAINAIQPAFFAELFPAERRYTGAAAGREIASIFAGGLTPFIATALAGADGTRWPLVAGYVMLGALITMFAVWKAPESFRRDLSATGKTVR
ncbi:MFS transporter [Nonomuraea sp. NPDC050451]|uniref:MFS transporter n=1 Tax=Nonomuraea sp. NPDC050451 TaxID=3364364 RepID=UPI0037A21D00